MKSKIQPIQKYRIQNDPIIYKDPDPLKEKHFVGSGLVTGWERPYGGVASNVESVFRAYLGESKYGSDLVQTCVDARSSFIAGDGIKLILNNPDAQNEYNFINNILNFNGTDDLLWNLAVLSEIEGRLLAVLEEIEVNNENIFNIKIIPYTKYKYNAVLDENDDQIIDHIEYNDHNNKKQVIEKDQFIFKTFGSSVWWEPNKTKGRISANMELIENISRIALDWRQINHILASPTPHFKCESQNEVTALSRELMTKNWKIGKVLVTTADYSLKGISSDSSTILEKEMLNCIERLSGSTGVPIFFLGFSKLLSNRATAVAMFSSLDSAVQKERQNLQAFFNELFYLMLGKSNELFNTDFDPTAVTCEIIKPAILEEDVQVLDRLLQLYREGAISLRSLLNYVPQINVDQEIQNVENSDNG